MYMILSPAVGAFGGHKNSTFYVKSAMSPEGRYVVNDIIVYALCIHVHTIVPA